MYEAGLNKKKWRNNRSIDTAWHFSVSLSERLDVGTRMFMNLLDKNTNGRIEVRLLKIKIDTRFEIRSLIINLKLHLGN